mmetsp:Transcript_24898/g.57739  ORF Transcript_24898/g.57739 Transcript_24898/m.57739 type:complete len:301 (-) Transcript_24898:252-1154(-)
MLDDILDKLLGVLHVPLQVAEGELRLDHPKLSQVLGSLAVLRAKRGAKRVDVAQRGRVSLSGELPRAGEERGLAEEVIRVIDLAPFGLGKLGHLGRQSRHPEQLAGSLAVGRGDQRRLHVDETLALEKLVRRLRQRAPHARHRGNGVCARAEVSDAAEELEGVALLLQGVLLPAAVAHKLHLLRRNLKLLVLARALNNGPLDGNGGSSAQLLHLAVGRDLSLCNNLDTFGEAAVVYLDEAECLLVPHRTHPPLDHNRLANQVALLTLLNLLHLHSPTRQGKPAGCHLLLRSRAHQPRNSH